MNKRLMFGFLFILILLPSISSTIELGVVKQFECVELYQTCPTCTYSDVRAIQYPNKTIITIDWTMNKTNSDFTYNFCDTPLLGEYMFTVYGDKGGLSYEASEDGFFEVTPSGDSNLGNYYWMILLLSIGVIALGFYKEDATITLLGSFGLYFVGLYILFYGIDGIKDTIYTWGIGIIILSLAGYVSIRSAMEFL